MLIDSHVNLHAPQFADDQGAVIERARAAGVGLMVTICDRLSSVDRVRAIAEANPDIWFTVGTHPHEAKEDPDLAPQRLAALAEHPKAVGIGETGLDFHYDLSPRDVQIKVFRAHIAAARDTGLPLVVHAREADAVMADILEEEHGRGPFRLLMHCYTSGLELLARTDALGAWFSVSGIATFRNAEDVRAAVRAMPASRIIVETDCPYLAPAPHRGRRNEPAYIGLVLAKLAEIWGWDLAEAEARTTDAFFALFERIPPAMKLEVTILGCGSSGGVPRADGNWGACDPADERNRRTRCSLLVRRMSDEPPERWTTLIVDASPELRQQTAAAGARRLDALLMTHDHADQSHGIDDIRAFALRQRARIPCHADAATEATLMRRFGYIFTGEKGYPAISDIVRIPPHGLAWRVDGPSGSIPVVTFDQDHGQVRSVGYRFGPIAYSSDVLDLPPEAFDALAGCGLWIVDALRYAPHPTHAHVERTLGWIDHVKPGRAVLTNLHIDLDYRELAARLPEGAEPAYDGMRVIIEIEVDNYQ